MARSIDQINNSILAAIAAETDLSGLTSTSRRAIYKLWSYIVAASQNNFEQLQELEIANIENIILTAPAGNPYWVQQKMFEFQYDATNPQIIQLNTSTLAYSYDTIDEALQIITRCSVNRQIYNTVQIKVAKGTTPAALSGGELSAAQDYINTIGVAGINYVVISLAADKMFVDADIYYKGQYSAVIEANVIAAIDAYFAGIDFNGLVTLTDLERAIMNVAGVNDVVLNNVRARKDSVALSGATYLVQSNTELQRSWQTQAGYIVGETTASNTLADTLNFIAQ
jgi:hypothetical protein